MKKSNKFSWKNTLIVFILIALTLTFAGCGMSSRGTTDSAKVESINLESIQEYGMEDGIAYSVSSSEQKLALDAGATNTNTGFTNANKDYINGYEQMIIYNGNLNMEVDDINKASESVKNVISASKGYLMNSNKWENENSVHLRYEFKVPVDGFYPLIDQLNNLEFSKVTNQQINGNDVTEEYYDLDSRLKAKRVYEKRLLELFDQATKTEDLLKISNDLSNVQEQIEQLEGRQKFLSYHASNSTLSIDMVQYKNKVAPTATTWEKALDALNQSLDFLKEACKSIFIWIFAMLPIIIVLGAITIIVIIIIRRNIKKNKQLKELNNPTEELTQESNEDNPNKE